jgi:hypothetical protein
MIEINLDSTNRKNNKIIINGEDICEKYKVTGFNLKCDGSFIFPILTIDILDEDIKLISDKEEIAINKSFKCDNVFWIKINEESFMDIAEFIKNIEYGDWERNMPKQLNLTIDFKKFKNDLISRDISFEIGQEVESYINKTLYYSGKVNKISLSNEDELLYITCICK